MLIENQCYKSATSWMALLWCKGPSIMKLQHITLWDTHLSIWWLKILSMAKCATYKQHLKGYMNPYLVFWTFRPFLYPFCTSNRAFFAWFSCKSKIKIWSLKNWHVMSWKPPPQHNNFHISFNYKESHLIWLIIELV